MPLKYVVCVVLPILLLIAIFIPYLKLKLSKDRFVPERITINDGVIIFSKDNFTDRLSALVERVKMNAQWRHRYMTWEQEMRIQAEERAQELAPVMAQELAKNLVKEEVEEKTRETARKLLSKNIPEDVVAECTGLKLSDVNKLLKG